MTVLQSEMTTVTILITDDDRLILFSLSKGLKAAGFRVLEAQSGEEALKICQNETPDLLILDMKMKGMSGTEVANWLLIHKPIPVIFLSAYDDQETVEAASRSGAISYLVKPVEVSRMIPAIHTALAKSKAIRSLAETSRQLSDTLNTSREISVAVGILMERHQLSQRDAFEKIRSLARNQRRKALDISVEIIAGRQIDTPRT